MTRYVERVRRGAELLDRARPGWERGIAVYDLAMSSCDRCILGQLYGDFHAGLRRLALQTVETAAEHGFADWGLSNSSGLSAAWRAEIGARLERGAIPT